VRAAAPRRLDAAVAVGVATVALAAAVHAIGVPGGDEPGPPELPSIAERDRAPLAARLEDAGLRGTLLVTTTGCRLAEVPLPRLAPMRDRDVRACSPAVSPRRPAQSGWSIWRRPELLVAYCSGRGIDVAAPGGPTVRFVRGCAPAWRPDGTLTYVRRGEATHFPRAGRAEVVLGRYELTRDFPGERRASVLELAWATDERAYAVLDLDPGNRRVLAVYQRGRLAATRRVPPGARGLEVAANGRNALLVDPLLVVPGGGAPLSLGGRAEGGSWSPDGRWVALARGDRVDLVETRGRRRISLPLVAHSVAWR
jgi:WD40-like Beta Propeller Repeat